MKKLLILSMILVTAFAVTAPAQTFRAPAGQKKQKVAPPPPISERGTQGAIPRGVRGGNPLQMLNPKAPARYGTAAQSVILDPDTGKWKGIKLFEFVW